MTLWQHLLSKLHNTHNVYLITVIQNSGSSPGRKGFKMLVSEDDFIFGSIGGGVMEFTLVEEAKKLLQNKDYKIYLKKQIHRGHKENASGMICSGEQTVVFHPLNSKHIKIIENILSALENNTQGTLELTPTAFNFKEEPNKKKFECRISTEEDWVFKEQVGFKNTLYIVGGGHVSVAVSDLFVTLGFHVVVFDDRENLNTLEQNTSAHQKSVIKFKNIVDHISEGSQTYVAIMTNRYTDDKLVLQQLINKDIAYLGVLGSKAKLKTMWDALNKEGISSTQLSHVNAPIGLPIKSQTPIEIAVSIAAEVIKIQNAKL